MNLPSELKNLAARILMVEEELARSSGVPSAENTERWVQLNAKLRSALSPANNARRFVRVPTRCRAQVRVRETNEVYDLACIDVSRSGVRAKGGMPHLGAGRAVEVVLLDDRTGEPVMRAQCRIAWIHRAEDRTHEAGFEFVQIARGDMESYYQAAYKGFLQQLAGPAAAAH